MNGEAYLKGYDCSVLHRLMRITCPTAAAYPHVVLAAEGYGDLLWWFLEQVGNPWGPEKEYEAAYIAAYFGHLKICQRFLAQNKHKRCDASGFALSCVAGAAEACRFADLCKLEGIVKEMRPMHDDAGAVLDYANSLVDATLNGFYHAPADPLVNGDYALVLMWVLKHLHFESKRLLRGVLRLERFHEPVRTLRLTEFLINELGAKWWDDQWLSEIVLGILSETEKKASGEEIDAAFKLWMHYLVSIGFDLVDFVSLNTKFTDFENCHFARIISRAVAEQYRKRSQFNLLKENKSLSEIQDACKGGRFDLSVRDKEGLLVTHIASSCDRIDVLAWLVIDEGMSLDATDFSDRDVLAVAQAHNSLAAANWILQQKAKLSISSFVSSKFHGYVARRRKHMMRAILNLQAQFRGQVVRKQYRPQIMARFEAAVIFLEMWSNAIEECDRLQASDRPCGTWQQLKELHFDFKGLSHEFDDKLVSERMQIQDVAMESTFAEHSTDDEPNSIDSDNEVVTEYESEGSQYSQQCDVYVRKVFLTKDVVKWRLRADPKQREHFKKKAKRLAKGEGGRNLIKPLKGCKTLIQSTRLEQSKGAHRILSTPAENNSILMLYVCHHDYISDYMYKIDDSVDRSARQVIDALELLGVGTDGAPEQNVSASERVQLDPETNTPLKIYDVPWDDIERLHENDWTPPLRLTEQERKIVECEGTVLILGRSGTGKSICIANRIDWDRHHFDNSLFSQLFIARSKLLCKKIESLVGDPSSKTDFRTFNELISELEKSISSADKSSSDRAFPQNQKVDFQRFRREIFLHDAGLDALIVWSHIRSFIKGSIEAMEHPDKVLSESAYLDLGRRRCRLPVEQRRTVYKIFQRYDRHMKENGLWDETDRVRNVVQKLESARKSAPAEFEAVRRNKVYVDEVQVFTQV